VANKPTTCNCFILLLLVVVLAVIVVVAVVAVVAVVDFCGPESAFWPFFWV